MSDNMGKLMKLLMTDEALQQKHGFREMQQKKINRQPWISSIH